jgi:hypothetical protein
VDYLLLSAVPGTANGALGVHVHHHNYQDKKNSMSSGTIKKQVFIL